MKRLHKDFARLWLEMEQETTDRKQRAALRRAHWSCLLAWAGSL